MKKLTGLSLLIAFCLSSYAQTDSPIKFKKGNLLVGGKLWYNAHTGNDDLGTSNKNPIAHSYMIAPELSYFLNDRLALGLSLNLNGTRRILRDVPDGLEDPNPTEKTDFINIGLNGRFLFPISERFNLFSGLELMSGPGKADQIIGYNGNTPVRSKIDYYTNRATISGGLSFHLSGRFVVFGEWSALSARWIKQKYKTDSGQKVESNSYIFDFSSNRNSGPFNAGLYFTLK